MSEPLRVTRLDSAFALGQIVATPNALESLTQDDIMAGLRRHATCDWGDVDSHDHAANELALKDGDRLVSVYHSAAGVTFWIITEADRSSTCVLLPSDY